MVLQEPSLSFTKSINEGDSELCPLDSLQSAVTATGCEAMARQRRHEQVILKRPKKKER